VESARPYRGVEAADRLAKRRDRLLQAGLDILGSDSDLSALTVRGICRQAGVTPRYFYESFTDKDDFVAAVYDWVIADIAASTQAAVAAARPRDHARAAMTNIVATIVEEPRIGRLLFGSDLAYPVLARKRVQAGELMAMLTRQQAVGTFQVSENEKVKAAAYFVVGGVVQTIGAWLSGGVELEPDQLVDQLASMIDQLADPRLYTD
jgi:AcrR family transcriptional regulator